jgi:hypothetical protein
MVAAPSERSRLGCSLFFGARYLSQAAQGLYLGGLLLAAGSSGSAAIGLSSIMVATLAASVIFGLPGGALADRLGAARGYALGSLLRVVAVTGGILLFGHPELLGIVAFAYSGVSQIFTPAELSLVRLIDRSSAARGHAILVVLQYAGQATGALLAALVLVITRDAQALLITAVVAYVVVALLAGLLALRLRCPVSSRSFSPFSAFSFRETFSFLAGEPRAAYAVGLLAFADIAIKGMSVALPAYFVSDLQLSRAGMIMVVAPGIAGVVLGMIWAARGFTLHSAPRLMRLTLLGSVVAVVALAVLDRGLHAATTHLNPLPFGLPDYNPSTVVALPVALLLGICLSLAPVGARAVLSEVAPQSHQGRVFASQMTLTHLVVMVPLGFAGVGTQLAGPRITFGLIAGLGILVLLVLESAAPMRQRLVAFARAS